MLGRVMHGRQVSFFHGRGMWSGGSMDGVWRECGGSADPSRIRIQGSRVLSRDGCGLVSSGRGFGDAGARWGRLEWEADPGVRKRIQIHLGYAPPGEWRFSSLCMCREGSIA